VVEETSRVEVDGVPLPVAPGLAYYLAYKPVGVISTADDPQGRPTVVDLVPVFPRVYPVGRLDADSEGLLLLTNDGDLANLVTHPRYGVVKTYLALVDGVPTSEALRRLVRGVVLDDGVATVRSARLVDAQGGRGLVEVVMGEGRKRELRRMLIAVGHEVSELVRTSIGPLRDASLRPGTWRCLTIAEVRALYAAASDRGSMGSRLRESP